VALRLQTKENLYNALPAVVFLRIRRFVLMEDEEQREGALVVLNNAQFYLLKGLHMSKLIILPLDEDKDEGGYCVMENCPLAKKSR